MKTDEKKGSHVSMWPSYFPRKKRERGLAFLSWSGAGSVDRGECRITHMNGAMDAIHSWEELVSYQFHYSTDLYIYKMVGKNGFPFFHEAVAQSLVIREGCTTPDVQIHIANSSKTVTMISVRGPKNKQVKIVSTSVWGFRREPTLAFLQALWHIFEAFDYGVHPSPASLGQATIRHSMVEQAEMGGEKPRRFSRPSAMLRDRLLLYGSGGRADDFAEHTAEYPIVYETDFDNHYANQALMGVPVDGYETFGLLGCFTDNLEYLGEFALAYVECKVTIPEGLPRRKISPFYTRHDDHLLYWETEPGAYYGWFFTPMIAQMVKVGYTVERGYGWGWRELSKFLVPFIEHAVACRSACKARGMELESDLIKGVIVGALGSFGTQPWRYVLVGKDEEQEGDEMFLDLEAKPCDGLSTPYYLRRVEEPDAPHLTQILYAVVMWANVELYKLALLEEEQGNTVLMTNYDAVFTTDAATVAQVKRKVKQLHNFRSLGKRSYTHSQGRITPGVRHQHPDSPVSSSLPDSVPT